MSFLKDLTQFKYSIFAKYKGRTYSINTQIDYDDAQIYMHPPNIDDTLIMVARLTNCNVHKITPSNFADKLPTLLTFS